MNYLNSNPNIQARYSLDIPAVYRFIDYLKTKTSVLAPHKKGEKSYTYQPVTDAENVALDYPRTIQPLKKFFLPPRETLLKFQLSDNSFEEVDEKVDSRIYFGIHSYEMQGLKRLDYSFSFGNPESNYLSRRKDCLFIGISFTPDKFHFGPAVGIETDELDGFCLYLKKNEDNYNLLVITDEGKKLLEGFDPKLKTAPETEYPETEITAKIKVHHNRISQIFEHVYKSDVWQEVADRCVGCGTCNLLCSTCYCFDVRDEIELDADSGKRERFWDSCMLNPFAEVAGGEDFRDKLSSRTRHRLYRKFKYITEKSTQIHCIGCGRCSKYCPADINIVQIINALVDDYNKAQTQKTY